MIHRVYLYCLKCFNITCETYTSTARHGRLSSARRQPTRLVSCKGAVNKYAYILSFADRRKILRAYFSLLEESRPPPKRWFYSWNPRRGRVEIHEMKGSPTACLFTCPRIGSIRRSGIGNKWSIFVRDSVFVCHFSFHRMLFRDLGERLLPRQSLRNPMKVYHFSSLSSSSAIHSPFSLSVCHRSLVRHCNYSCPCIIQPLTWTLYRKPQPCWNAHLAVLPKLGLASSYR